MQDYQYTFSLSHNEEIDWLNVPVEVIAIKRYDTYLVSPDVYRAGEDSVEIKVSLSGSYRALPSDITLDSLTEANGYEVRPDVGLLTPEAALKALAEGKKVQVLSWGNWVNADSINPNLSYRLKEERIYTRGWYSYNRKAEGFKLVYFNGEYWYKAGIEGDVALNPDKIGHKITEYI